MVIRLERGADLHLAQLMPLPLTVSCFSKMQIGFIFLVPAHPGSPDKGPLNTCICVSETVNYRAMLCIRGTSRGPVSVCLSVRLCPSVTSRSFTKTAKQRITKTTPHDTPKTPVFWCQRSPRNSTGVTPYEGAECRWGGSKSATFDK